MGITVKFCYIGIRLPKLNKYVLDCPRYKLLFYILKGKESLVLIFGGEGGGSDLDERFPSTDSLAQKLQPPGSMN